MVSEVQNDPITKIQSIFRPWVKISNPCFQAYNFDLHNIQKSMTATRTTALRLDSISQNHNRDYHYQKNYHNRIHNG